MGSMYPKPSGTTSVVHDGQLHHASFFTSLEGDSAFDDDAPQSATVTVVYDNREKTRRLTDESPSSVANELLIELVSAPRRGLHMPLSPLLRRG